MTADPSMPPGTEKVPIGVRPSEGAGRERFLRACAGEPTKGTPVWLMRQAGRVLPEYRALKERYSFLELVRTPELAAEVTLQPVERFAFDAAILFSDILVIPEALGQPYRFREEGGVEMAFALRDPKEIGGLDPGSVPERLGYVTSALRLLKRRLAGRTALIGFSGAPWTLANFMIEGGSSPSFGRALEFYRTERAAYDRLAGTLTEAIVRYLRMQLEAGADALQLFDTLAGLLPTEDFEGAAGRWLREIASRLPREVPLIVFAKGARVEPTMLAGLGARVLSFDATVDLGRLRELLPAEIGLQGNLDPAVLETNPEVVTRETRRIMESMRGRPGHIFNLGHGVPPGAPLSNLEALVSAVRGFA